MPEAEMARGTKQERRHAAILQRLRETGTAKVEDLCVELGVSMHTIRRDLEELHERGVLRRVHGGAAQLEPLDLRQNSDVHERTVAELIDGACQGRGGARERWRYCRDDSRHHNH